MSDDAGNSASALAATRDALSARHADVAAADEVLSTAVTEAHRITVESLRRLAAIEAEIEASVLQQHLLALDTPAGVRDFHRFLLARQHDITAVITEAVSLADEASTTVQALRY